MLLWINCFLTLCVFLVCYNLWSGSPNGGSPYSGELDCGSSILKQPNSLLYKILSFSGFCIQSSSPPTPLSLTLLLSTFWKSQHNSTIVQVDWFCPSCCSSAPSMLSCPAGEGWCLILCISCTITCKSCGNETFLFGDIELNTYLDIQFAVTYEKISPWWVSKLRNVGEIPQHNCHIFFSLPFL